MKIPYKIIKKIHLYACLSTVAVLVMFVLTSYVMIYHDHFDHESTNITEIITIDSSLDSDQDRQAWTEEQTIPGRLMKSYSNKAGHPVLEYQNASTHTRLTFLDGSGQVEISKTTKSKADAFVGIHRNRGFGGGMTYNAYAILLDVLGVSLLIFTITGMYMWIILLKKNKWAWIILVIGLVYFISIWMYLTYS